ncbi:NAD-dependent epimerase/dehydratase family protein [Yunchengibacter salinarum]|uniref:NAD-dependent epimerase/dehydratase family protein n=1 Tax=Yunchengibacter salinarum TaxID=3133399 RepID=UPI0035B5B2E0
MRRAALTGATGFIGRHLSELLLADGWHVTALVRDPAKAETLLDPRIHCHKADLTAPEQLQAGLRGGVDAVFHTAADTSTWSREADRQRAVNVTGTGHLIQAHQDADAGRMVHVSSIAAFGLHRGIINEDTPQKGARSAVSYVATKAESEKLVRKACARGLDGVIVNPTHIVGRYDTNNWARLITMVHDGSLPAIPPGGGNFAHGRSVAKAMVTAIDKAPTGARYILGGPYASFREFIDQAAELMDVPVTAPAPPAFVVKAMAYLAEWQGRVTGKRPRLTPEEAYFACETISASSDKAARELGYETPSLKDMIGESVDWLRREGHLPDRP